MKKLLSLIALLGLLTASSQAITLTATIAANTSTNLPLVLTNGPCTLLSIIASSPVNNTANFFLYDAPTTNLTWTNASYNIITTIPTNTYITTWTNYYGATNYMTNRVVMEITNTIAGSTNYYNQPFYAVIPTNSTVTYNNLNIRFLNSLMLTNTNNSVLTFVYSFTQ